MVSLRRPRQAPIQGIAEDVGRHLIYNARMFDDENDASLRGAVWGLIVVVSFCSLAISMHGALIH